MDASPRTDTAADTATDAATDAAVDAIEAIVRGRRLAVLTGAGVSTDSGIPDYRGAGAPTRTPMTFADFMASETNRQRYWMGSHLGWRRFTTVHPNDGHRALAALERVGVSTGVVTQNVDGLHTRAGSQRVVELHGAMNQSHCLDCGQAFARDAIARAIEEANPWLSHEGGELGPDGDVIPEAIAEFAVPRCTVCGGMLKPDVVFFGEFIPRGRFDLARTLVASADALLIAGSSLMVNSGIRLLEVALRQSSPVVIINRGETKGDSRASLKVDAGASPVLAGLAARLGA